MTGGGESYRPIWEVIVGNIGEVYSGYDETFARETFETYKQQSIDNYGRGGSEEVTLMLDNEPEDQYFPPEEVEA